MTARARASFLHGRGDRGSVTLELAVLTPGLLLLIGLLVVGGRMAVAGNAVQGAAADAARSASISRSAALADESAEATASTALTAKGLQCARRAVEVDASGFAVPVGLPADITVTVTCDVDLSDLVLPGVPGVRTLGASVTSPLDTYRER